VLIIYQPYTGALVDE